MQYSQSVPLQNLPAAPLHPGWAWAGKELEKKRKELAKLEAVDYRNAEPNGQDPSW